MKKNNNLLNINILLFFEWDFLNAQRTLKFKWCESLSLIQALKIEFKNTIITT